MGGYWAWGRDVASQLHTSITWLAYLSTPPNPLPACLPDNKIRTFWPGASTLDFFLSFQVIFNGQSEWEPLDLNALLAGYGSIFCSLLLPISLSLENRMWPTMGPATASWTCDLWCHTRVYVQKDLTLGLMLCCIPNNFVFGLLFYKQSPMGQWSMHRSNRDTGQYVAPFTHGIHDAPRAQNSSRPRVPRVQWDSVWVQVEYNWIMKGTCTLKDGVLHVNQNLPQMQKAGDGMVSDMNN